MASPRTSYLAKAGIVASLLVAAVTVATFIIQRQTSDADLELVSSRVLESGWEIELLLRNSGGQGAVIHKAIFIITEHKFTPASAVQLPNSAIYNAMFPLKLEQPTATVEVDLSQEISQGDPDKFTISVGVPPPAPGQLGGIHDYTTTVTLLYNDPPIEVRSKPLRLSLVSGARNPGTAGEGRFSPSEPVGVNPGDVSR